MAVHEVDAFQCSVCESVYLAKGSATRCSRKCLRLLREIAARRRAEEQRETLSNRVRLEAKTFDDIWILLKRYAKKDLGLTVKFRQVPDRFSDSVRNTHGCPVGGVTNWHGKPNLPNGYPGWNGNFEGTISGVKGVTFSDLFGKWGISEVDLPFTFNGFHTSSGCGGKDFRIGGYIFIEDFPLIAEQWKVKEVAERLSGLKIDGHEREGF